MKIKSILKRSLAVVLALMMLLTSGIVSAFAANVELAPTGATVTYTSDDILFFNMSAVSWWTAGTNGNGNFAYFYNNSTGKNAWSAHAVQYSGSVYYVKIPAGTWEGVILTRNNTSTAPSWNNKWNQTGDIALSSTSNYISKFSEGSTSVTWSTQKPASTGSLAASATSVNTGTAVTLTPSLTSNTTYNEIKSTSYSISPSTGASISSNTFKATTAGTYTVTATITYNPRGYSNLTSTVTATKTITVTQPGYSYTVSAGEGGSVTPSGSGTGTSVNITAAPSTGYKFAGWETTNGSVANSSALSTTFTPSANGATVKATFEKLTYTVNFKDEDGTVLQGPLTVEHGGTPSYTGTTPTKTGHSFSGWLPALGAVTADTDYIAQYSINDYTVTVTADPTEGGSVTGGGEYVYNSTVTLTASPDTSKSYVFVNWELTGGYELVSGSTLDNSTIVIKVTDDVTAKAVFSKLPTYEINTTVNPAQSGNVTVTSNPVIQGNSTNVIANPAEGYTFVNWEVTSGTYTTQTFNPTANPATIFPQTDVTVKANFRANKGFVTFSANNGTVTNSGANEVTYPATISSTATPNTGYHFTGWTITGGEVNKDYMIASGGVDKETIEIRIITDNADIKATANFAIDTFTVRFFAEVGGQPLGEQTVEYGKSATAPAEPTKTGYTFNGWDTDFSNVTSDLLVHGTFKANEYTVRVVSPVFGGTAAADPETVTYPGTVTLTATPTSADYVFTGWNIQGEFEFAEGSDASKNVITIKPVGDLTVTPSFAEGQYLTVYTYSEDGFNKLTLTESNGSATKTPINGVEQQNDAFTFGTTKWDASAEVELTPGYSNSVTAQLAGEGGKININDYSWYDTTTEKFLCVEGYRTIVFTNEWLWPTPSLYAFDSSNKSNATWPGVNMQKAYTNSDGYDVYVSLIDDKYTGVIFSGINNNNSSERQQTNDITLPSGTGDVIAYTIKWDNGNFGVPWDPQPTNTYTINAASDAIELKDYLYNTDGSWAGNTKVWIYQDGANEIVTLRGDLLDLITSTTTEYNGGVNAKDYTADSWSDFVAAYTAATTAMADVDAQQTAIDDAKDELLRAFNALELQAYYTVYVVQKGESLGTVTVGGTDITGEDGSAQVTQGTTVDITVKAPAGYYIESITGDVQASNQVSPYEAELLVNSDKSFSVAYKKNPAVSVTQTVQGGTVTVNGSETPVNVEYGTTPVLSVKAPDGYYISNVMVGPTILETNTAESLTANEYTLPAVTVDTTVIVTYAPRTSYVIKVEAYDTTGGKLYVNDEEVPAAGKDFVVYAGDVFTVNATPADRHAVDKWVVGGADKASAPSYQFTNINDNHTITVVWKELQVVDVTIKGNPNSVASVTATSGTQTATNKGTNSMTITEGEQVTLTLGTISDTRYQFSGWTVLGKYDVVSGSRNENTFVITAKEDLEVIANFTQVYRRIYLKNDANWTQPYAYHFGGSTGEGYPGEKMTYDSALGYWYRDVPIDITGIKFNQGGDAGVEYQNIKPSDNLFTNGSSTTGYPTTYVEAGYYLQGTWNGKNYSAYDQVKFAEDTNGNYVATITVTSTTDGYIYVNPSNEKSHFWVAATANATDNPQTLTATTANTGNKVKVEIDPTNFDADYDVTFTFNPTTGNFSWTTTKYIPRVTIVATDGQTKELLSGIDDNMQTSNERVGDTYFDYDTVISVKENKYDATAESYANEPVTFFTQVNKNTGNDPHTYDYRVEGWVINGTEFVYASNLGNGLYSGSYVFTEEENTVIPVYFHTQQWLDNAGVKTVTVYAVADHDIQNWDKYMAAYTWYKVDGDNKYEQFGRYSGQVMIPVAGLDGVYYTIVEYGAGDKIQISGITFNNYANGDNYDVVVNDYGNIQTYDYYEFVSLLGDGKENITFVLKDTNNNYNRDDVNESSITINSSWNFEPYVDYSGLKTDIFGNNIEANYDSLLDSNALYVVQAGNKDMTNSGHQYLDGQWYVECYLYNANGKYLGKCYSYELHKEDSPIWDNLAVYENQRVYFSYETVNGGRYDGEWYGDAQNVSVTINLSVNVALMGEDGKYTVNTTDPVNVADYGTGYINATEQSVDVKRGDTITLSAMPKSGYKFVGWYSADGKLFTTNIVYSVTAAIGTTYTAVFEPLEEGQFYVNHYIYKNDDQTIPSHGGNAVLYVGIENKTTGENTGLIKGNSANLEVTENDKLIITIATDATGADKFYSWYTDAYDKFGNLTYEEVGVDSADNLYDNKGTVVGRNDIVYFQFEYTFKDGDDFAINLYSDLLYKAIDVVLAYGYGDRYNESKYYYVNYILTAEEIEGFAGNNFEPYTPAYISGDGWINTILANAPYIEGYYKDSTWIIDDANYDTMTYFLWATQPDKKYTVTIYKGADTEIRQCNYNDVITLDATELFGGASGYGFWYEDVDHNGGYNKDIDKIITYNAYYGYRVTSDMYIGYEKSSEGMQFDVSLDDPVYSREQETDNKGNVTSDKVSVDYMINIVTPHLYGQEGWTDAPIYKGQEITENWNGAHVTLESYEKVTGATVEYGVIIQQFGASITIDKNNSYADALAQAIERGYTVTDADNKNLIATLEAANGQIVAGSVAYKKYEAKNHPTNFNRVLFTINYTNNTSNQGKFFNAYGYVKITQADGTVEYYFSSAQYHNIYETGTAAPKTDTPVSKA